MRHPHRVAFSSLAAVASLLWAREALTQEPERPPNVGERSASRDSLPFRRGQWGAEFLIDDGTVGVGALRFRSARRAWLLDASLIASWYDNESSIIGDQSLSDVFVRVRGGPRRYAPLAAASAAHVGFGVTAGYGWAGVDSENRRITWDAGLFGELGGVYFVTRRLSLGAQVAAYATFSFHEQRLSNPQVLDRYRVLTLQVRPVRIVGGLYF